MALIILFLLQIIFTIFQGDGSRLPNNKSYKIVGKICYPDNSELEYWKKVDFLKEAPWITRILGPKSSCWPKSGKEEIDRCKPNISTEGCNGATGNEGNNVKDNKGDHEGSTCIPEKQQNETEPQKKITLPPESATKKETARFESPGRYKHFSSVRMLEYN